MKTGLQPNVLATVAVVIILCAGCTSHTVDIEAARKALLRADADQASAASTNNMKRLWSLWSEDATMLMTADWWLNGIDEIKSFTIKAREDPNFSINWQASGGDVSPDGLMGYSYGIGTVTRTGEDGEIRTDRMPYLTVWRKHADGSWRVVIEN